MCAGNSNINNIEKWTHRFVSKVDFNVIRKYMPWQALPCTVVSCQLESKPQFVCLVRYYRDEYQWFPPDGYLSHTYNTDTISMFCSLTHLPLVPHICVSELGEHSVKFWSKCKTLNSWKCIWKYRLRNSCHFVQGNMNWFESLSME